MEIQNTNTNAITNKNTNTNTNTKYGEVEGGVNQQHFQTLLSNQFLQSFSEDDNDDDYERWKKVEIQLDQVIESFSIESFPILIQCLLSFTMWEEHPSSFPIVTVSCTVVPFSSATCFRMECFVYQIQICL